MLAVIGPSASGKSTLVRALVGLWPPFAGTIKLDGVKLEQWDPEDLGQHIGYLPQDVELFAGTVRDNIARFRTDASDAALVAAAKAAHAHELIMALPKGYDTELGAFGQYLSAGQRQRIGLSRALFGNPALVVLDEPNANLDRAGDEALAAAIDGMRARGPGDRDGLAPRAGDRQGRRSCSTSNAACSAPSARATTFCAR